jgi:hypothetical protein
LVPSSDQWAASGPRLRFLRRGTVHYRLDDLDDELRHYAAAFARNWSAPRVHRRPVRPSAGVHKDDAAAPVAASWAAGVGNDLFKPAQAVVHLFHRRPSP